MKMSVKIARIPPIVPTIINKNRFWNLSEYLPNKGGKINIVNGKIERISCINAASTPKFNKYNGIYVIKARLTVLETKTKINIKATDRFDNINFIIQP